MHCLYVKLLMHKLNVIVQMEPFVNIDVEMCGYFEPGLTESD